MRRTDVGRRCSPCGITWPDKMVYERCPQCLEHTDRASNVQPLLDAEAESILKQCEFERYYEKRGARDEPTGPAYARFYDIPDFPPLERPDRAERLGSGPPGGLGPQSSAGGARIQVPSDPGSTGAD